MRGHRKSHDSPGAPLGRRGSRGAVGASDASRPEPDVSGPDDAVLDAAGEADAGSVADERLRCLLELSGDCYWEQDEQHRFTLLLCGGDRTGRGAWPFLGRTLRELDARPVGDAQSWHMHETARAARLPFDDFLIRHVDADGRDQFLSVSGKPVHDARGRFCGYRGIIRDVTALDRLRSSEALYASTFELAAIGISHVAQDGRFIHVNRQLCEMLGYEREELLALSVKSISHPDDVDATDEELARLRAGLVDSIKVEKRYLRKDGTTVWVRITIAEQRAAPDMPPYDISVVEDVSARRHAEERIQYLATHDDLTSLPNRTMFGELLEHAVESSRRRKQQFAVLFIDLDRFKNINDSLGHEAGDLLLKEMSSRLRAALRGSDVVARLGGDEFVVLLEELERPDQAASVARKLLSAVLKPVEIFGQECRVTGSVGIAMFPDDADDARMLMRHADMAMYLAKEEGKNNYQFYSKEITSTAVERLVLETHLRRALEQDEFMLHYQPKVDLRSSEVTGVEALLRWWNPALGTVPPAQFIPLAEETGLIVPIGKWVLKSACEQNVAWQRAGLKPVRVAVNLSPRQFKDEALLDDIAEILEMTRMRPDLLELEITESMIMSNVDHAIEKLSAIKNLGVRLAIDDFGTGYSSLSQLKRFPIDTLKIDRSFIRDVPTDVEDKAITEAIVSMGRALGVSIVAEGVESALQETFLRGLDCDEMQGFHFAEPRHPDAIARLLRAPS